MPWRPRRFRIDGITTHWRFRITVRASRYPDAPPFRQVSDESGSTTLLRVIYVCGWDELINSRESNVEEVDLGVLELHASDLQFGDLAFIRVDVFHQILRSLSWRL